MGAHQIRRGRLTQPVRAYRCSCKIRRQPHDEISRPAGAADLERHRDQRRGRDGEHAKRKAILEEAYAKDPAALSAGAPTSLGVLYSRVPGWPVGFGDNDKARQLLAQAATLAPNGMDANYFYADFLMNQHEYAAAYKVLKHALALPPQKDRPLWDKNRRAVIRELMAKAQTASAQAN